jgi:hypothetical protein
VADDDDFSLLNLANEKGKFGLLTEQEHEAFGGGIENEWFRLVDVSTIAHAEGIFRVFKLTEAGLSRLAATAKKQ